MRALPIPLALVAASLAAAPAEIALEEIRWSGHIGLDSERPFAVPNTFNPFSIHLTNGVRDFTGTVEIRVARPEEDRHEQRVEVLYRQPLELALNADKRIEGLFFMPEEETELEIRLIDESGDPFGTPMLLGFLEVPLERRTAVVLGEDRLPWEWLRTPTQSLEGLSRGVAHLEPRDVPPHWAGLSTASTLIWDGAPWQRDDPRETQAVDDWVHRGGVLVLGLGANTPQLMETALAPLVPLALGENRTVPAGPVEGWLSAAGVSPLVVTGIEWGDLPEGSRVFAQAGDGLPLVVDVPVGLGHVVLVTCGLEALVRANPPWRDAIAGLLVPPGRPWLAEASTRRAILEAQEAMASLSRVNLPEVEVIGRWLAVLWVVLIPVNFGVAWAIRRPRWGWVTAPLIALGASYHIHRTGVGGALAIDGVHQVQFAIVPPESDRAWVEGLISIYSPAEDTHRIRLTAGTGAISPVVSSYVAGARDRFTFDAEDPGDLTGLEMEVRTLRSMGLDAVVPLDERPVVSAQTRPPNWSTDAQELALHWKGDPGALADAWALVWEGRAFPLEPGALSGESHTTVRVASAEESLAGIFTDSVTVGSRRVWQVILEMGPVLQTEAERWGPVCLVGFRNGSLTPLHADTARAPRAIEDESARGEGFVIVPVILSPRERGAQRDWPHLDTYPTADHETPFRRGEAFQVHPQVMGAEDILSRVVPTGHGWRGILPQEFSVRVEPAHRGTVQGVVNVRHHLALWSWREADWVERDTQVRQTLTWSDAASLMHPLTGEALLVTWISGTHSGMGYRPNMGTDTPASDLESVPDDWDVRQGPVRVRPFAIGSPTYRLDLSVEPARGTPHHERQLYR